MAARSAGTKTGTTTRTSRSRGAAATAKRSARALAEEAEEFVEVTGGDFPAAWDFEEQGDLLGTFLGTETKDIKGKTRTLQNFELDGGEKVMVWGTAILDSRLEDVEPGTFVKVVKTGAKLSTKSGRKAWEFKVFARRGALRRS